MADDGLMQYFAKFGLDASEFLNGMEKSQKGVLAFYRDVTVSLNMTMMIFDRFLAYGQQFINLSNQAAEYVSTIDKLAVTTGMSTEELQRWDNVALHADSDINTLAASINKMQINLAAEGEAGDRARQMLDKMGVSYRNADGSLRSSAELFPDIIQGLKGIESSSDRVTIANTLFGRSYQELAGYMDLSRADMERYFTTANVMTEEQAQSLRDYEDAVKDLNASSKHLANTAGSELAPSFTAWAGLLDGLAKNQGVLWFFGALNLALEMVAEGFVILGTAVTATNSLLSPRDPDFGNFDRYKQKLEQTTRDVAVMRDRFKNPEAYEVPEEAKPAEKKTTPAAPIADPFKGMNLEQAQRKYIIETQIPALEKKLKELQESGTASMEEIAQVSLEVIQAYESLNTVVESDTDAIKKLADKQRKLNDLNKEYTRDLQMLDSRDVQGFINLRMRHEFDLEDQQKAVDAAQVAVDASPIDRLAAEYDGSEIGMTVVVDTTEAEKKLFNLREWYGLPPEEMTAPTAAAITVPAPAPELSEAVDVLEKANIHLPDINLPAFTKAGNPERASAAAGMTVNLNGPITVSGDKSFEQMIKDQRIRAGVRI